MTTLKILLNLTLLVSSMAAATPMPSGYERGNGGFLLQCSESSTTKVVSLDRKEGEILHHLPPSATLENFKDEVEMVNYILDKLAVINPSRAETYKVWLIDMIKKREFVDDLQMAPLNDGNVSLIPVGCNLKQAAIFITGPLTDTRYLIDRQLWQAASVLDRAYLLMHELIYQEARLPENDHANSLASRYLNAWLLANIDTLSSASWLQQLLATAFIRTDYQGIPILLNFKTKDGRALPAPLQFYPGTQQIQKAVISASFTLKIQTEIFTRICFETPVVTGGFTDYAEFYPTGKLKHIVFQSGDLRDYVTCQNFHDSNDLKFDESGNLIEKSFVDGIQLKKIYRF